MRILFVTWDGPQVTYLESLFLPIFARLQTHGIHTDVLQFRWGDDARAQAIARACAKAGMRYRMVEVKRRGGAVGPLLTALIGGRHVSKAVRDFGSDVVLPRSLMPALSVLMAHGAERIVFDADGLPADERVEFAGLSPKGVTYRMLRAIERRMTRRARAVLVRSQAAVSVLSERADVPSRRFHVVANGRDEQQFRPLDQAGRNRMREAIGVSADAPLLVYAGSIGPQYRLDLIAETALRARLRRPDARLLMLTSVPEQAHQALGPKVLSMTDIRNVPAEDVPLYLAAADVGLAFRAASFSSRALAPIKLGEYLLCGLPVIGTAGVGNTAPASAAGVFFDETSEPDRAAEWVMQGVLPQRTAMAKLARQVGLAHFSLSRSVEDYLAALRFVVDATEENSSTTRGAWEARE